MQDRAGNMQVQLTIIPTAQFGHPIGIILDLEAAWYGLYLVGTSPAELQFVSFQAEMMM